MAYSDMNKYRNNSFIEIINMISEYRSCLMGLAILWVMLHHSGLNLSKLFVLKRTGYAGVDIFMLLSGLGCSYSLSKNDDIIAFYVRRCLRIVPHYIPVLLCFLILNCKDNSAIEWVTLFLGNATGFSFWASHGVRFNWYILAIPLFYLLAPIIYSVVKEYKQKGMILVLLFSLIGIISYGPEHDCLIRELPVVSSTQ